MQLPQKITAMLLATLITAYSQCSKLPAKPTLAAQRKQLLQLKEKFRISPEQLARMQAERECFTTGANALEQVAAITFALQAPIIPTPDPIIQPKKVLF